MSAPHNKARYGETWDLEHINLCRGILEGIRTQVVLSGGAPGPVRIPTE